MRRSWRMMSALALVLAASSILFSAWLFTRVQEERTVSIVRTCERDSARSRAIIGFLREVGSRPSTVEQARVYFPVLTRAECRERARRSVGPPPRRK